MIKERKSKDSGKDDHVKSDHENIPNKHFDQYNLFQKLIDNIPDYIYIKDKKNRFVMVNSTMADFYGKKPEDFIGKTDFDFSPQENAKEYFKDDNRVIKSNQSLISLRS